MKYVRLAALMVMTLAVPSIVFSQESNNAWGGRAFVTFNVGAQTASPSFGYEFATTLFEQSAKAGLDTPGKSGPSFDIGAGLRLVQNLGVGVTYSHYSNQRTATLTTTIPSPAATYALPPSSFYNYGTDPSTISEQMPLQREENAVHIEAIYRVPIGSRVQIGAFGGPSYFRCADDHITKFALVGEFSSVADFSPPFNWSVAFRDISQLIDRGSAWGYHGGGNVTYLATRHVGLGMTVRYSHATHTTMNHFSDTTFLAEDAVWGGNHGTASFKMQHGGIQWNGGVSLHF